MKISLSKRSTSILEVFMKQTPSKIKSGIVNLHMVIDRKNSSVVASLPYILETLYYEFNLSNKESKNLGDFDYFIEIISDDEKEISKKAKIFNGVPRHIAGAVKKIKSDFRTVAKTHNGSLVYMFKRMPGEQRCEKCWDEDLMSSNNSSCETCGGKGFMTYYSNPYKTYGSAINFQNEKYGTQDQGKTMENTAVTMSALADFVLTTDDMVYYDRTGDWYRVKARTVSELQSVPTLQMLVMDLMPSGAPETETAYKLINR